MMQKLGEQGAGEVRVHCALGWGGCKQEGWAGLPWPRPASAMGGA